MKTHKINQEKTMQLYDQDFVLWSEQQAHLMKNKQFHQLDLENLIEEIEDMGKSIKRSIESQLIRLMMHIIKWKIQPSYRSQSWINSIEESRRQIVFIQDEVPSLNANYIQSVWEKSFEIATRQAEKETHLKSTLQQLTWQDVFEEEYILNENA